MQRHWQVVLAFVFAGCAITVAHAQSVAQRPAIVAGDAWKFNQTLTPPDEKASKWWSRTVLEVAPNDVLKVRNGDNTVSDYDGAMNFIPEGRADYTWTLVKYPLKVGDEWELSRKFQDPRTAASGKAKVVAQETITVPAGTFDCYRVEAEAQITNPPSYHQDLSWTRWYCPDAKWIAKQIYKTSVNNAWQAAGNGTTVTTSELAKFTPGK